MAEERKLRMGMVGGGPGAFIGPVHRIAAELDGKIELVAGAFSQSAEDWCGDETKRRRPRSRVERPVPPPIATTRRLVRSVLLRAAMAFAGLGVARVEESVFTIKHSHS